MPLYDFKCKQCQLVFEHYALLADKDTTRCSCGGETVTLIGPVKVIGPMPSKPLNVDGFRSFDSNAELRAYQKANPSEQFMDKGDSFWVKHKDSVRERCEKKAVREGYKDYDHKRSALIKRGKGATPSE